MNVVALLAVRNEERYLSRCLEHHYQQEITTCLIDNGSTDRTLEIARSFLDRGVIRIEHLPFSGVFELETQLRCKERLAAEIGADWFPLRCR
jgi:glycosyltransferase involved in cell wall biosynthesis